MKQKTSSSILERVRWYEKMVQAYQSLSDEQRTELDKWDVNKGAEQDLTDWPGWASIIGPKPKHPHLDNEDKK